MKQRKILILMAIGLMITNIVYAKYSYYFEETIIELTRNSNLPFCNVSYSIEEETNQNVVVTITANKEVEPVSGFELLEDKKTLQKEVTENENRKITVRDFSGNCVEVEYNVSNIDKEAPVIVGCEEGGVYESPFALQYYDNVQVKEISVDKYSEDLVAKRQISQGENSEFTVYIEEHPLNTKKYRYYVNDELYSTVTEPSYTFVGLKEEMKDKIKIEALDEFGSILDSVIVEEIEGNYQQKNSNFGENELIECGNYRIEVSDFAGNKTICYIKVK